MVEPQYNVTICGGGNLAHASIATIGHNNPKYRINLLSRRPEVWNPEIKAITEGSNWEHRGEMKGSINKCSANPEEVIPGSHIILICSPAHTKIEILQQIKPFLEEGAYIGTIFG
jgi:glycerol-3-phosphate dehydrogenase